MLAWRTRQTMQPTLNTSSAQIAAPPAGPARLRYTPFALALIVAALILATLPFTEALDQLYDIWNLKPEYSHGVLIPLISLILVWRQRNWLASTPYEGSWSGLPIIAAGLLLWFVGDLSTIFTIVQYGFLLVLYGLVLALTGWNVFRRLWMPLVVLIFMVPLPAFFGNALSLQMQLISSAIGVAVIRLAGISVFLEGNVIDLGTYQLQVAEACDGLRYMFPLMTLAFIVAYFFRAPFWKRAVLFVSSVPIAILMNSFRIGVIGITVEYWGPKMAEGMLHDFEGWVVFMLSTLVLILIAMALNRMGSGKTPWRDALAIDMGPPLTRHVSPLKRQLPPAFIAATALAATAAVLSLVLPERVEIHPPRASFAEFPSHVGEWRGRREAIDPIYSKALQLDDYVFANFARPDARPINFYVAYYSSQRKGQSTHSPRSCIPGGGWSISDIREHAVPDVGTVNRAVVQLGMQRQIVYYWFRQRDRQLTDEYRVKWFIFWDALTRNRTDGAMIRLTAPVQPGQNEADVDRELAR